MLTITSASVAPCPVEVGKYFAISIKIDEIDTTWSAIKNNFPNWEDLKNNCTLWKQVKQL